MATTVMIGARRRRFALEAPVELGDGAGGVTRQFKCIAQIWGAIEALGMSSSASRDIADRRELASRYRIVLRWRDDINGTRRLRLDDRVFAVLSARDPDGRRRDLVVVAEEVTP
ncbi:phage head closure protein [Pseudochelatococcus sp. G4_1912]|uniref:phage head closure protein n=1 Tax=Pseudochelatococcus sp. G4_1912 TaxID=3114288 RepID=UPI0039C6EDAF